MKAETGFSLKDQLFNRKKVVWLARQFSQVAPDFDEKKFSTRVLRKFPELELKQRIDHITCELHKLLPEHYPDAISLVLAALPPPVDANLRDDDFGDFIIAPLGNYVAQHGLNEAHLDLSFEALEQITQRFSAEDAIRYFINAFPDQSLEFLHRCTRHPHYHVRRLASEGTRPSLPWCQKIVIDYRKPITLLDELFSDRTRFVTRSVANHLNDISKLDPDLVLKTLRRWKKSGRQAPEEMAFIEKHSLRTLIKQGNRQALKHLGFGARPDIHIRQFSTDRPEVVVGDAFEFVLEIQSNRKQNLAIDYEMLFAGQGSKRGRKVFKLKTLAMNKGEIKTIRKRHPMRLMTTRRLYAGEHEITLKINGEAFGRLTFLLKEN